VTRRAAAFLYTFAGWTLFVWVVFVRNILKDHTHSTGFKVVHVTLAVISVGFAAGTVLLVRGARQRLAPRDEEHVPASR
jgi:hypothetical protein